MPKKLSDPAVRSYVKLLQNPYASLSIVDEEDLVEEGNVLQNPADRELTLSASQNPWAWYSTDQAEEEDPAPPAKTPLRTAQPSGEASMKIFERETKRILNQYQSNRFGKDPKVKELTADFIAINRAKSPATRAKILLELERFDLTKGHPVDPVLNRVDPKSLAAVLRRLSAI